MVFVLYKEGPTRGRLEVFRIILERTLRVGSRTQDLYHRVQWGQSRHRPQTKLYAKPK
jgi:hypothetical protein